MMETVRIPYQRKTRYSAMRLVRRVAPPYASVLVLVSASRSLSQSDPFLIRVDGRTVPESGYERIPVSDRTIQLMVHGDNFSWLRTTESVARLEVHLDGQILLDDSIEVAAFQR